PVSLVINKAASYDTSISPQAAKVVASSQTPASVLFFFQAEDAIRVATVTGVQTCALPISCIQVLNEAIKTRAIGQIVSMVLVELAVALFEVLFLYRELIDAITPWLAQQGFQLGI